MPELIACKGLPASGKSSWAKAYVRSHPNVVRINRDDLRLMLHNVQFDESVEGNITAAQNALMACAVSRGMDIVLDNTNLSPKIQEQLETWTRKNGYTLKWKDFTHVPLTVCIERDKNRGSYGVGKRVITNMWRNFLQEPPEQPEFVEDVPYAIICDLDGTLAHINNHGKGAGRSFYDASRAGEDLLDPVVAELVASRYEKGDVILFCSGRDEAHRNVTESWLDGHGLLRTDADGEVQWELLMRPKGDNREDSIIKTEIYEKYIKGNYNIRFVLDDRQRVVDAWRSLGLKCLQVEPGDF